MASGAADFKTPADVRAHTTATRSSAYNQSVRQAIEDDEDEAEDFLRGSLLP